MASRNLDYEPRWPKYVTGFLFLCYVGLFIPGIPDLFIGTVKQSKARELVDVKYFGPVDLSTMNCKWTPESSFVNRICFDPEREYAVVSLNGIYFHYCGMPLETVSGWAESGSLGRYYNVLIKGRFACG